MTMPTTIPRCRTCGTPLDPKTSQRTYCSRRCAYDDPSHRARINIRLPGTPKELPR